MPEKTQNFGSREKPEPFFLVIFGASGDLTERKLIPAVFRLFKQKLLPEKFGIIGFARSGLSDQEFREKLKAAQPHLAQSAQWEAFAANLFYQPGQYDKLEDFRNLGQRLETLAREREMPANCLFYLSIPPVGIESVIENLAQSGLNRKKDDTAGPWSRVIVEKPFGRDRASARQLNAFIQGIFDEKQIFRIDHYLGKETVQNLLVLRFANAIFEPLWSQQYIDHVQITVSETVGVENRAAFYEQAGALRDIVQNHMMHLLALVAMEPPIALDADSIRDAKVAILRSLRPLSPDCARNDLVRAQYAPGKIDGQDVLGYRQELGVASVSRTETFVALKIFIDNWRWAGVPFYLRTGKRLARRITEIGIYFKPIPQVLFNADPARPMEPNFLAIRIQPNEGIALKFQVKRPGFGTVIEPYLMSFNYSEAFGAPPPEAYERLLLDAALGDPTLFTRADEVELAWQFLEPILAGCAQARGELPAYAAGNWGPVPADELIQRDGRKWELIRWKKTQQSFERAD